MDAATLCVKKKAPIGKGGLTKEGSSETGCRSRELWISDRVYVAH